MYGIVELNEMIEAIMTQTVGFERRRTKSPRQNCTFYLFPFEQPHPYIWQSGKISMAAPISVFIFGFLQQ